MEWFPAETANYQESPPPPAILFVANRRDLFPALEQVNRLLAFRRIGRNSDQGDRILAVCFSPTLDSLLLPAHAAFEEFTGVHSRLTIQESFCLSGVWNLCWVGSESLRHAIGRREQHEVILQSLSDLSADPSFLRSVHPVYDSDEVRSPGEEVVTFRQDPGRGLYCESTAREVSVVPGVPAARPLPFPGSSAPAQGF